MAETVARHDQIKEKQLALRKRLKKPVLNYGIGQLIMT